MASDERHLLLMKFPQKGPKGDFNTAADFVATLGGEFAQIERVRDYDRLLILAENLPAQETEASRRFEEQSAISEVMSLTSGSARMRIFLPSREILDVLLEMVPQDDKGRQKLIKALTPAIKNKGLRLV